MPVCFIIASRPFAILSLELRLHLIEIQLLSAYSAQEVMNSSPSAGAPLFPLEKFLSDFFKAVAIQDDEKVFQEAMHRDVSRHVKQR